MAGTDLTRLAAVATLLLGLAALNGCMFVQAHFDMAHSGAVDALMEVGVLKAALEGEGAEGEMNVTDALQEGQWEEPVQFDRGEYRVSAIRGHAEPGQQLFKEGTPDIPRFASEKHLLTTVYRFDLSVHFEEPTVEPVADPQAPAGEEGEGLEGLQEMFSDLATVMIGETEALRFACTLPGQIAETNGTITDPDTVTWRLGLSGEGIPEGNEMRATSRLINWEVMGAVGESLIEIGREDLALPLISGAQRGIIPDPPTENPMGGEIDLPLYVQILDIMVALDDLVREELTDQIMVALKLNVDEPDRDAVAAIAAKAASEDFAAGVSKAAVDNVVWKLLEP